jgi:hypothetical protein
VRGTTVMGPASENLHNSGGRGQRDLSSGLPPTADVAAVNGLRFRANSRLMQRSKMVSLFDHFVDATEQR